MDIQIVITAQVPDGFTSQDAAAEMCFDFGIGNPENGETWLNMNGQAYDITDFQSFEIVSGTPILMNHHLTNMGVEPL